ncbi:WAT1-related protein At1g25270-like isoform X2 [Lotus japonicus]|uniref:WAT1-related protein At1g25270-like isoform X2 n=1 Tax=Lotus japonicus TaxID=34305 RepID=UPI00258F8D2D|nr:WAT1-related protein At1g25270-like isoform X2 [Lotus japonicus]
MSDLNSSVFISFPERGTLFQNLFVNAISLISATFATAIYNLVPGITFMLGIFFGFEQLNIGRAAGQVKLLGTIVGIGGSMLLTFFKGAEIHIWTSHINLLHQNQNGHGGTQNVDTRTKTIGVLCGIGSCISFSFWLIIQAKIAKEYPRQYTSTALMTLMAAIQCTVFALWVEKDWSQWKLGWSLRLLTATYSGIMSSGVVYVATAWCVRVRGPMFASVFNPLTLIIVAIGSSLVLNEKIYLGSVIGGVLIVCGLYMVLWGKSKETKKRKDLVSENTQEVEATDVVSIHHGNCDTSNNSCTNSKSNNNVVSKFHDESSKSEHQPNGIDNEGAQDVMASGEISREDTEGSGLSAPFGIEQNLHKPAA